MCACVLHTRGTRLVLLANITIVIVSYYHDYRWYRYYRSALLFRQVTLSKDHVSIKTTLLRLMGGCFRQVRQVPLYCFGKLFFQVANIATEYMLKFLKIFVMKAPFIPDSMKHQYSPSPSSILKKISYVRNVPLYINLKICLKCSTLYKLEDCIQSKTQQVKMCMHIAFPRHSWPEKRMYA